MRLQVAGVCPTPHQQTLASQWLFVAHRFRNEAVAFLTDRGPDQVAERPSGRVVLTPPELSGNDVNACSTWLTAHLAAVRSPGGDPVGVDLWQG